jgi:hypothetical protein
MGERKITDNEIMKRASDEAPFLYESLSNSSRNENCANI